MFHFYHLRTGPKQYSLDNNHRTIKHKKEKKRKSKSRSLSNITRTLKTKSIIIMDTESSSLLILRAMLQQEKNWYEIKDYFQQNCSSENPKGHLVDADARQQIAQWCMNIMDACDYSKENAAVTMSCLDRFVSTRDGREVLLDRSQYQSAALTALYISIKVHCPQALSPDLVAKLSQGMYGKNDIEAMERRMLDAIQWRINPPTAMDFVRIYLDMIASKSTVLDQHAQNVIIELAGYQASRSVLQFDIVITNASTVGVASLLNAIESIYTVDNELCDNIYDVISLYVDIDPNSLESLQQQLYKSITEQTSIKLMSKEKSSCEYSAKKRLHRDSFTESPRSVAQQ